MVSEVGKELVFVLPSQSSSGFEPLFKELEGRMDIDVGVDVTLKNRAGVLYRGLNYEAIDECFRFDKARTASFLNVL